MPRVEDIAWKFVIREGKKWRCPYCENKYAGNVTRVRSHFLKQSKDGISSCKKVPEPISTLMDRLHNHQVRNKDDIAWKFVDRLGDNNWRCRYCCEEFSGDLTGVKGHLLKAPNEGISICTVVPDPVRTLMRSLLDEVAEEEESRDANGQSSTEPQSRDMPTPAELVADEEESREANVQFSTEPQSRDMPTQAEETEEGSREANSQFFTGPRSRDMLSPAVHWSPQSWKLVAPFMANFTSDQQEGERQFHQRSTTTSLMQNSHGGSISCSRMALAEGVSFHLDSSYQPQCSIQSPHPEEMQMNDQQTLAGASSFQYDQLPAIDNSKCLQDCNQHSQLLTSMDIDPSIASQHPRDSHFIDTTIVDLQVPKAATNTIGPSSSQESFEYVRPLLPTPQRATHMANFTQQGVIGLNSDQQSEAVRQFHQSSTTPSLVQNSHVPPQPQSVPSQSINPTTEHQNSAVPSSSWKNHLVTGHPQALMDMDPCMPSSSQAPKNGPPPPHIPSCGTSLIDPSSLPELDMSEGVAMMSHPNTGNNFEEIRALKRKLERVYSREARIRNELEFAASLSLKKQKREVANWLADVEKLRNDFHSIESASEDCLPPHQWVDMLMQETEHLLRQGNFQEGLFEARETKISKLLEGKIVGEAFKRNTTKVLEYLVGNQISRLGIYGMGGVGKTTIMVHIHNKLLEKANYGNVLWITVSKDFNTQKLQDDIWKALGLGTLEEEDVRKRAATLYECLTKRGKFTIILDDVWEYFDLEEVGIPIRADKIKLVLTTRSFVVCCQMQCQEKIKIEPLSQKEAESLFLEELGSEVVLNLETEAIVKSIVEECAGLPLGIITMARSMRGVTDLFEWKDSLVKLKESSMGQTDMEKNVLMRLKISYDRLQIPNVQQCFLSCALYPEDNLINKFELIEFFIDQGLIGGLNTREKQYDRGFTILNKLENVCLLEDHGGAMKMHDLIRDMALHIMSATSIVKAGKGLSIPLDEYWSDALEKVSLMEDSIREFPWNMSPNCPKLSTFLLNASWSSVVVIPDSFFKHLLGLQVLNLSGCNLRELPDSISDLVNLKALLLRQCWKLHRIPYLGKLISLGKLDICGCAALKALEGLEKLVNLRYLDVTDTCIGRLPKGTLVGLKNLQFLRVGAIDVEDVTKLWPLEVLECYFEDVDDFNKCVRVIKQSNPRCYELQVDQEKSVFLVRVSDDARLGIYERRVDIDEWSHAIVSAAGKSADICILIPQDVQTLRVRQYDGTTNLSDMGLLKNLEELNIREWKNLGVLCGGQDEEVINIHDSPAPTPSPPHFRSLRVLTICRCPKLKYVFGHESKFYLPHLREIEIYDCDEMVGIIAVTSPPPHPLPAFPSLTKIEVWGCDKLKRVVESEWLSHFPNLRDIFVFRCENMEEIIGSPPPYIPVEEISLESLSVFGCNNIRKLFAHEWLIHLRNLQSIRVGECEGMAEMIGRAGQGQEGSIMTPVNNTPSAFQFSFSLPKLKCLRLADLRQLKSICEVPITCDTMDVLEVSNCPEVNRIPLQLRLRDSENLPHIEVDDEEKWNTLIWDHPNAQAILQPLLLFRGSTCVLNTICPVNDYPRRVSIPRDAAWEISLRERLGML